GHRDRHDRGGRCRRGAVPPAGARLGGAQSVADPGPQPGPAGLTAAVAWPDGMNTRELLPPDQRVHDRRWWTLAVLCLSLLIVFVGNSSLNVTIPTLSRVLGASNSQLQWVIAIYSLVFAGLLFSSGAVGDRFGRKGALQAGLGIYLVACLL